MSRRAAPLLGLAVALASAAVLLTALPAGGAEPVGTRPGDIALIRSASGWIPLTGGSIVLPVEALNVANLGAATIQVGYDRDVISATSCVRSTAFDIGICNTAYDSDNNGLPDAVRVVLNSVQGVSSTAGLPLNLARITWSLVGAPPTSLTATLAVSVPTFTNQYGEDIGRYTENGRIASNEGHRVYLPLTLRQ